MPYRQFKPKQEAQSVTSTRQLSNRELTILTRQSTTFQALNNQRSMELQLNDALAWAEKEGFTASSIRVRQEGDGKRGVSGTLRIDQRIELQETIADIMAAPKDTMAIRIYDVSRLFRDPSGAQVGVFIDICIEYMVLVITDDKVYDFARSQDDIFMFKLFASMAAKENAERTKRMHNANRKKSLRGEYDGRPLVVGFIVDRDKTSKTYGHFIVYEPHAKVVRRLYARYRELGGRFNLLAKEVALMAVVFPSFEDWVSPLDIKKLQLGKVPGGYHISRVGLFHLMQAVEYCGWWKYGNELVTDTEGQPLKTHDRIVDASDWEYAFTRLSQVTLAGATNQEREGRSWVPATKADGKTSLLHGILTSPLGTVQNSDGKYKVTEKREGHSQRSNTLTVDAKRIDLLFSERLAHRLLEMHDSGNTAFLNEQLEATKQKNEKALVTVDQQIAKYRKEIANKQAVMAALGTDIDKETAIKYNTEIIEARANMTALEAKKNAAIVEEEGMRELIRRISQLTGSDCLCSTELSRRFIELACESVCLDEYSSHLVTLTIVWRVPFQQVDVCYIYREDGGHQAWNETDDYDLAMLYPLVDRKAILERFPTRTWSGINTWASAIGLERYTRANTSEVKDRFMCLADWHLRQAHGWNEGRFYWVYDVTENDDFERECRHS